MAELCVCGSGKAMKQCCLRFLSGDQLARTPEQLMRSRFSAYFLGNHGQYLLQTWFPATAKGLSVASLSQRSCDWTRLEVLDKSQQGDQGFVEFNAWFNNDSGSE
ncbi:MAG: YchJ family metal-binding protein, partial [Halioglobus sp.]